MQAKAAVGVLIYDNTKSSNHSVISQLRLPSGNTARWTAKYVATSPAFADAQEGHPFVQNTSQPHPMASSSSLTHDWTNLVLRKELLTRISTLPESPEAYREWKQTSRRDRRELNLSESEQLDFLVKWLGPQSQRQAVSFRQAHPNNPQMATLRIWERIDERYGAPEMVEHSLKKKLADFLTNKDPSKLYLVEILLEIESTKADPEFGPLLSYLDTS